MEEQNETKEKAETIKMMNGEQVAMESSNSWFPV